VKVGSTVVLKVVVKSFVVETVKGIDCVPDVVVTVVGPEVALVVVPELIKVKGALVVVESKEDSITDSVVVPVPKVEPDTLVVDPAARVVEKSLVVMAEETTKVVSIL